MKHRSIFAPGFLQQPHPHWVFQNSKTPRLLPHRARYDQLYGYHTHFWSGPLGYSQIHFMHNKITSSQWLFLEFLSFHTNHILAKGTSLHVTSSHPKKRFMPHSSIKAFKDWGQHHCTSYLTWKRHHKIHETCSDEAYYHPMIISPLLTSLFFYFIISNVNHWLMPNPNSKVFSEPKFKFTWNLAELGCLNCILGEISICMCKSERLKTVTDTIRSEASEPLKDTGVRC